MNSETVSSCLQHSRCRSHREILLRRPHLRSFDLDGDSTTLPPLGVQGVAQVDQAKERLQAMKPIVVAGEHAQEQIQLGQRGYRNTQRHYYSRLSPLKPPGVRASDQSPSSVIGMNDVT